MSTTPEDDAAHARFRRGASTGAASTSAVQPPPPLVAGKPSQAGAPTQSAAPSPGRPLSVADLPGPAGPAHPAPAPVGPPPPTMPRPEASAPVARVAQSGADSPAPSPSYAAYAPEPVVQEAVPTRYGVQPLFADLVTIRDPADSAGDSREPLYDQPEYAWEAVDDDPGRTSGIVSIVLGVFIGIAGLIVGFVAVGRSRRAGHTGTLGIVGVIVSIVSIAVGSAVGISLANYEIDLQHQCALAGPGTYLTQSGTQVTCR